MLEVTVKTLDGKNKSFSVPDNLTVKQFKEKISNSIVIPADKQRLIYQGKVLQDDKTLGFYGVHGKVIHAVERSPPTASVHGSGASTSTGATSATATTTSGNASITQRGTSSATAASPQSSLTNVMGSFTLPTTSPANHVQDIVQNVLSGFGSIGRNATVTTRATDSGSSVDVHINLGPIEPPQPESEAQQRLTQARRMIRRANATIDRLENPLSTTSSSASARCRSATDDAAPTAMDLEPTPTPEASSTDELPDPASTSAAADNRDMPHEGHRTAETTTEGEESHVPGGGAEDGEMSSGTGSEETSDEDMDDTPQDSATEPQSQDSDMAETTDTDAENSTSTTASAGTAVTVSTAVASAECVRSASPPEPEESSGVPAGVLAGSTAAASDGGAAVTAAPHNTDGAATSSGSTASTTTNSTRDGHQHRRVRHPHPPALGNMLTELMTLNARLQPHMEAYQQLMSQDPPAENEASTRQRQRLCNLVSSAMHYISHAYHNLSDLMIDMGRATPRDLRATPTTHTSGIGGGIGMPSTGAAVFTHAIPIQAHIQIGNHPPAGNNNNPGTSNSNTNRTNGNASTSSNATSSSSSSSSSRTSATVASNVQLGQQGIPLSGAQSIPIPGGNLLAGQPLQISLPPAALDGILGGITNSLGNALEGLATGITSGPGIGVGGAPPGPLYTSGNLTATTNASSATSSGQLLGTTQSGAAQLATSSSNTSNPAAGSPAAASGGGAAGAPLASSDPVVFMELGPQAVTINSISAHLVETNPDGSVTTTPVNPDGSTGPSNATTSSASSTASGSGTNTAAPSLTTAPPPAMGLGEGALHDGPVIQGPGGAQIHVQSNIPGGVLPPNVMNTIMQSVAGLQSAFTDYAAPTHTASSTSSIQSNATNTSSTSNPANASQAPPSATTAASTASHGPSTEEAAHTGNAQRSNATPGQEPRMRMRVPRRGFPLRRSLNPDPHLPCNSHHFLHHRLNSTMHHRGMRNVNRRPYPHRHQRHHHHHRTAPAAGGGSSSNSRGVGNPQQRASSVTAPPAPQRAQQSGRSAASNTTEQDQNLTQMVENIVGSIIRQAQSQFPGAVGGVGLGGVAGATPIATIRMTAAPPGASPRPGAGGPRVMHHHRGGPRLQPHHRHHHHNHRSGGPRQTGAVPLARTMQGDARPTRGGAVAGHGGRQTGDLAAFAASLTQSLMSNQGPQPGAPRQSLGQFLTSFGDQLSFPTDNSILARLLQCILNNITLTDLTHIVLGNSEPLNGLLPHLQAVIRDHLLHNQPATPANVTAAVQEFIAEFDEDITACQRDFTGRDNINYTESVRRLAQHHLEILVKFIHEHNDQATFGAGLMARCKALCDEFLALSLHTLENGESDLRRFIQQRLMHLPGEGSGNTVSGGTDGQQTFIHTMLNSHITQYIHTRRNAIAVPLSTLNSYIIRNTTSTEQQQQQEASSATTTSTTSTPITSAQPAVPTDTIRSSGVVEVATCNNSAAPTHLPTTTPATAAASAASLPECEDDDVEMRSPVSSVLSEPAASLSPPVVPSPSDASPSAPSAPEGWQAVLPQEWVPIITTDIQRQAEQPPQQPFSDAYINGMPAKRRKITETKQQSVSQAELAGTGSVIPEAIEQAMVGAGVQPNTSVEALRQEAENDETLHQAFEQQVRASVRKRLDNDPDYVPEKYPNAEKFFKPQK